MTRLKELVSYESRLNDLFRKAEEIDDIEIKSHFARYLCVLTSGYIETSLRAILEDFAERKSHPYVSRYVAQRIKAFQNPSFGKIEELIRQFDPVMADHVSEFSDDQIRDAVNSVVNNRHQIAHGSNTGLSIVPLKNWKEKIIDLIGFVESEFSH